MKQFGTIFRFELKNYVTNKIFVGITVFLVAAITIVMFIPRIASAFESENTPEEPGITEEIDSEKPVMLWSIGRNNGFSDIDVKVELLHQRLPAAFPEYNTRFMSDSTPEQIKKDIADGVAECAVIFTSPTELTYYVNNLSMYDMNAEIAAEVLTEVYRTAAMIESGMTDEQIDDILNVQIIASSESIGKNQMQNFFYTYIMIFALYMVILLYGQMVATNVATEKSSRAMELLITSAKPVSMMFGKVLASCAAGFIQLVLVFGSALFFFNLNKEYWGGNEIIGSIFNIPPELLVFMLVFFVLGFLIYAFMFGAIGSTASKLEDVNTSTLPVMFLFILAFLVVMESMAFGSVDNTLMKICSFIPFTSPMAMFTRIAMSTVPWVEIAVSIVILIASTVGIGVIAARIYRVGVLLYGTPPKLGAIIKAVWKA